MNAGYNKVTILGRAKALKGQMSTPTNLDLLVPSFILVKLALVTEAIDG